MMNKWTFLASVLTVAALVVPLGAQAGKPYQRFDDSAIFENSAYQPGQRFCVEKRTTRDGEIIPWAQYKVVGINELDAERFGTCDPGVMRHQPSKYMAAQFEWEHTQGRRLFTSMDNGIKYHYSPGSLICQDYKLMKIDHKGRMRGTGRYCGTMDKPTLDPR